jgi:hypothetical protein
MKFSTASVIESITWQMKLADYPRSENRSRINDLFNGVQPYTDSQVRENNIATNVNFLESTKLGHDARRQFYNAFLKTGNFFNVTVDAGPKHKRKLWSSIVTKEINRRLKQSLTYFEAYRSTFASVVLHGIGPTVWPDRESWEPDPVGVEDVMVPSNTLLSFKNLPFFAVFRQYTAEQLYRMTHGPNVDPAWNMEVVDKCVKWADEEAQKLSGSSWPEVWSPEKMSERLKSDGGFYASDAVQTIDAWDFYFWNDENKESGWNRRIILDAWSSPGVTGASFADKNIIGGRNQFLYNPGDRVYASSLREIIHFQLGDLSAVAPFRYHSIRGLGFLVFAICHLQNRLRCKFSDAVFEHLTQYFRIKSLEDAERTLKINLVDKGFVDESVDFIKAQDRWQINEKLVTDALQLNQALMGQNTASFTQDSDSSGDRPEKTATQVMAEVNQTSALVQSALTQAYRYEAFKDYEICRRFCIKNSADKDVRKFRAACLREGIDEKALDPDRWDVEHEQVLGGGNKMLEITVAQQLMAARNLFDPEPQRDILRDFTLAVTDDPGRAERLVPESPRQVTDSVHDAQLAAGTLLQGLPVSIKTGMNHLEYVETLLASLGMVVQKIEGRGSMATPDELFGLQNLGQHIAEHIQIVAQDESQADKVKQYGDDLGKLMNIVKAYAQRLEQQAKEQAQGGNGGPDPKELAKIEAMKIQAQAKAANTRESHAQRTAQRQTQWQMEQQRKSDEHKLEMQRRLQETQMDSVTKMMETEAAIHREGRKPSPYRK